jgi:hypothetical protein
MFSTRSVSDFKVFQILAYLHRWAHKVSDFREFWIMGNTDCKVGVRQLENIYICVYVCTEQLQIKKKRQPNWEMSKRFKQVLFSFFLILIFFNFIFCSTEVWTQGLHPEPLHQPYFCDGYFWDKVSQTICWGWLQALILLISASWVAQHFFLVLEFEFRASGLLDRCSAIWTKSLAQTGTFQKRISNGQSTYEIVLNFFGLQNKRN